MSIVVVSRALAPKQNDARRINRRSQWTSKNSILKSRFVTDDVFCWLEVLNLFGQPRRHLIIRVQSQDPRRLNLFESKIPLGRVSIEKPLNDSDIWMRCLRNFQCHVRTAAVDN